MEQEDTRAQIARLAEKMDWIVKAVGDLGVQMQQWRKEFVSHTTHDAAMAELDRRVSQLEEHRKTGGFLNWWRSVRDIATGITAVAAVAALVVVLSRQFGG